MGSDQAFIGPGHKFCSLFNHLTYKTLFVHQIVNIIPQVNEKGVLERMHITHQCWVVLESLSLKSFPTHSLWLYLVFMLVRAENPLSHRYVVAKGISVFTLRYAKAGYSERSPIQKFASGSKFNFHRIQFRSLVQILLSGLEAGHERNN